jgi:hypothetical protein
MNLIRTSFGGVSSAAEVAADIDLTGRRALVTGASSDLGVQTARALAGTGAEVTLAVREVEAGERAAEDSPAVTGYAAPHVAPPDLTHPAAFTANGAARIVVVSSSGHQLSPMVFDDVDFAFRSYDPWPACGQSETANALMPAAIHTNLQRHTGGRGTVPPELTKTPEQGAASETLLSTTGGRS